MSKRNLECENLKVILRRQLNRLKVNCVDEKIETLLGYMNGVLLWNDKVNLTNILNENDFVKKHYIDSLSICSENEFLEAEHIIDVGTGGGFPGIPLAICYPEKKFILFDSRIVSGQNLIVWLAIAATLVCQYAVFRTRFGLRTS